jgi:protein-export membrane protein SecD
MRNRNTILFTSILVMALIMAYIDLPKSPGIHIELGPIKIDRDFVIRQGLDLQGGLQVLLEADVPADQAIEPGALGIAAQIIESRVNALGVTEPLVQTQGDRRIIVELPGIQDPELAIATIKETGLLEFIDAGDLYIPPGTKVQTTYPQLESEGAQTHFIGATPEPTVTPGGTITPTESVTSSLQIEPPSGIVTPTIPAPAEPATSSITSTVPGGPSGTQGPAITDEVFATVLTGADLKSASVQRNEQTGAFLIAFELKDAAIFEDFTGRNVNKYLSIVLDKEVISSPVIKSQIPGGKGVIEGTFTLDEANRLVVQLRYGSLPLPLRVETTRSIGPTLGQDSVQRSIRAGAVGLSIVLLFMLLYYRVPGLLADLALALYGLLNLAVYKVGWPALLIVGLLLIVDYFLERKDAWPLALGGGLLGLTLVLAAAHFTEVTLTLPAITGFILSTGMAVDANILVFERMKEELRGGKNLNAAIEAGFSRAWTSIRDSNISTLITCAILYYFGSTFGAGTVRGFAITLALGVVLNIFTAITVTRTFMRLAFEWLGHRLQTSRSLLGA